MKKLTILLFSILISFSSYAGWFGNSIEGAFDMKLGEDAKSGFNSDDSDWGYYDHDTDFDIDEDGNIQK
jgi:hypothetical protein